MMRKVFTGLCLLLAAAGSARAAEHDGRWSVLVITEKGACDPGYRYEVSVGMDGTITPNGSVKVSVGKQGKNAIGSGQLSAKAGAGTWHSDDCAGRWEAERR
jgi:hypothetical protein